MTAPRWQTKTLSANELPITVEYLREVLDYCSETGTFTWKHRSDATKRWNSRYEGKKAGTITNYGKSVHIFLNRLPYKAHRLAWLYIYGDWPSQLIDHIDGNPLNNAISNLRTATYRQNSYNRRNRSNNTSGFKGVSWRSGCQKWSAEIVSDGKRTFLGLFDTAYDAHVAYCAAAKELHGEFACVA